MLTTTESHGDTSRSRIVRFNPTPISQDDESARLETLMKTHGTYQTIKAGTMLFLEGEPSDALYFVVSGVIRGCRITADGRRHIARFVTAGEVMALTAFKTHDYTAEAVSETRLLRCPRKTFERLMREDVELRDSIFEMMASEIAAFRDQMVLLGQLTAAERAATFLMKMAARNAEPEGELHLPMTRQDIADYLGMTLETVSRMFNNLKRKGVIEMTTPDRIRICDARELAHLAAA